MVKWIGPEKDSHIGMATTSHDVTPEVVADATTEVLGDFVGGDPDIGALSEKYGVPLDHIFMLAGTVLAAGAAEVMFDDQELYQINQVDEDLLKQLMVLGFLIGHHIHTVATRR